MKILFMLFCRALSTSAKPMFLVLLIVSTLAAGCNQESARNLGTGEGGVKIYTDAELNKLIASGMSVAEVMNKFGPPSLTNDIGQGIALWVYSFPLQPEKAGLHLAGFSIYLKDGNVVKWSPMMEESRQSFQAGGSPGSFGEQSFKIFLTTDALTNVANTVDSNGSADASNLKVSSDLEFKAKVFAGSSGSERSGEQTVILVVGEQDASKLRDLTENNFGKRLLIVCRNQVVAAPIISTPLASRQLMFTVKSSTILSRIQGE